MHFVKILLQLPLLFYAKKECLCLILFIVSTERELIIGNIHPAQENGIDKIKAFDIKRILIQRILSNNFIACSKRESVFTKITAASTAKDATIKAVNYEILTINIKYKRIIFDISLTAVVSGIIFTERRYLIVVSIQT